ncbi:MAG: ComF family protein [Candidatus Margulisiibacteriota bacterium]
MMKSWLVKLFDLIFPRVCCHCGSLGEGILCEPCRKQVVPKPHFNTHIEGMVSVIGLFPYEGPVKSLIRALKFEQCPEAAPLLVAALQKHMGVLPFHGIDAWIPVPSHPDRLRKRGYNHLDLVFSPYFETHQAHYTTPVNRTVDTPPLHAQTAEQRKTILRNCFRVEDSFPPYQRVAVVDDILTSGATLTELAKTLKHHRNLDMVGFTLAYVPDWQ